SPENARMIPVFATITPQPGQREAVLALFNKNRPAVLAETGCISYEAVVDVPDFGRSEEHTSELQSPVHLACPLLLGTRPSGRAHNALIRTREPSSQPAVPHHTL